MERKQTRKVLKGIVVSNKMDKTAMVKVVRKVRHPKYEKLVESYKKYYAHDEKNEAQIGQEVVIMETRPLSKNKRWRILSLNSTTEQQTE